MKINCLAPVEISKIKQNAKKRKLVPFGGNLSPGIDYLRPKGEIKIIKLLPLPPLSEYKNSLKNKIEISLETLSKEKSNLIAFFMKQKENTNKTTQ